MKIYLVLYLAIVNTLSGTGKLTKPTNVYYTPSNNISCYKCGSVFKLGDYSSYNHSPYYFTNNNGLCTNKYPVITEKINTNTFLCALNIVLVKDHPPKFPVKEIEKLTLFHFTTLEKKHCLSAKQLATNAICLHSSCRLLTVCCDQNLCNTVENFNLMLLAIYSNYKDKNLKNNYAKYTDTTCKVNLKNKTIAKNQPCIVASENMVSTAITNKNITSIIKNTAITTSNNSKSSTQLNYSQYLLLWILLCYQNIHNFLPDILD